MMISTTDITTVGVMVAHPDDEILWAGGMLLMHPGWQCRICTLCRASDADREPKFRNVLRLLGASDEMADLDDGPDQRPLAARDVEDTVAELAGKGEYDLILTHGPSGEYTRHLRHEETSRAVRELWRKGIIRARAMWLFAYRDQGRQSSLPQARDDAHLRVPLPQKVWDEKYRLVREVYGFAESSWEARTTPGTEGFWCFDTPDDLTRWSEQNGESL